MLGQAFSTFYLLDWVRSSPLRPVLYLGSIEPYLSLLICGAMSQSLYMDREATAEFDREAIAEFDRYCDADKDVFGDVVEVQASSSRKFDVFDVNDSGFDALERNLIASEMIARAQTCCTFKQEHKILFEADRFAGCGIIGLKYYCRDCRSQFYVRNSCHSRICPTCASVYARRMREKIEPILRQVASNKRKGYALSLLTLTVTSKRFGGDLPSRADLKRLYAETSTFLRLNYGKYAAHLSRSGKVVEERKRYIGAGWFAVLEFGADNNNAHCHIVTYGPIRRWHKLLTAWEGITTDSRGVDIRIIRQPSVAIEYVLKYIWQPPWTDSYKRLVDYAFTIKGTRRLRSGGIFYNCFTLEPLQGLPFHCAVCAGRLIPDGAVNLTVETLIPSLHAELRALLN